MEEKRGIFTYFTGIARLILFIILLAIITFFVVRWIRARQDTKIAQQAAQGQSTQKDSNAETKTEEKTDSESSQNNTEKSTPTQNAPTVEVPGGIADSNTVSSGNQKVPNAGIESSLILTTLMISLCTYSFIRFTQSRSPLAQKQ